MKKISLVLLMFIIIGICVPAVSAESILDEHIYEYIDTTDAVTYIESSYGGNKGFNLIVLNNIENHPKLNYIGITTTGNHAYPPEGKHAITYTIDGVTNDGTMYVDYNTNILGQITGCRFTVFFYDWDVSGKTGRKVITLSKAFGSYNAGTGHVVPSDTVGSISSYSSPYYYIPGATTQVFTVVSSKQFEHYITVETISESGYMVTLDRYNMSSILNITKDGAEVYYNYGIDDKTMSFLQSEIDNIAITGLGKIYSYPLTSAGDPSLSSSAVTVYVRDSQTYALIANANLIISASVNGTLHEVVNKTIPSGIYSIDLQPTGGGMPNPDFYRLIVTAEGYNSIMPYIDFEFDEAATIYSYLDPIGGAPEDENNTFIDFFVRDMSANPISGATVNFGGYTLITNSAGYTIFEVDKSKTYSWTVSKSGYGSLTGNAVIGSNARHTINTVLAPAVTPTTPTAIPTSTPISPTPTMTAPTGEPVSNWLEWFAAHFGMILGGGAEIGKIFMWLCFAVPVGVYVGKEAKAGAAGFMAGAGVVTLFFVLIGWLPIWLLVLIALIIGLLYAKVFNNSDNGGGR